MGRKFMDDSDILCYRLKSKRRKKRLQHWDKEKQLLRLDREETKLWRQKQNLGWIDLHPPIMRGYKRFFVLRPDVAKSKRASMYENILSKINNVVYGPTREFKRKKRRLGRKIWVEREQYLLKLTPQVFAKAKFNEVEKAHFIAVEEKCRCCNGFETRYVFTEPWRFVLRVRPHMITQVRIRDEVIEKRLAEIYRYFQVNHLRPILNNLKGYRNNWLYREDVRKVNANNPLWNKPLHQVLAELEDEKI